ncbi:sensor histidine kinase [Spongiactinospora sp. TRM90649]|uniref:sensor histidine kinase n=1 Tax=Spongiactinospora sp. TRM90649 TaxID=3031114 RepID=UPI0023F69057|nr:sensor histidine kinase [Spongiactinospora sp. TRM90649]MDF5755587.1 sensor histidine kinase [Spongiactinospora sp. TRM90649]
MTGLKADAILAVVTLSGIVGGTYAGLSYSGHAERPLDTAGLLLITLASLALTLRRRTPFAAGVVAIACGVGYYAAFYPGVFAAAPALISIYTVATLGRRRQAIALALAMAAGVYGLIALDSADPAPGDGFNLLSGWLVAMVVIGEVVRNRRAYLREVERRLAEAERTKEEAALRRAADERLWIAQELHDALTHSISVVNVQAGVAAHLIDRDPARTREALDAIRESGREAMRELRATLGVLRQADPDGPAAGMSALPRLLARAESAGLTVTAREHGTPRPLPPALDRAAYRILQEALTNVLRHAGSTGVTVTTDYRDDTLVLRVDDSGTGEAVQVTGGGMGLIGMRERAVAAGGTLTAEPVPGGGFTVRAELPLGGPSRVGSLTGASA